MSEVTLQNISKVYDDVDKKRGRKKAVDNISCCAYKIAVAWPIPEPAPVTRATLFSNIFSIISVFKNETKIIAVAWAAKRLSLA